MRIYKIDPTRDERWDELLQRYSKASVFHTRGWLEALQKTHGYVPVAFTTSPPESRLKNGIPFCEVSSWLSGRRLVSLPFSDHCSPLVEDSEQLQYILTHLRKSLTQGRWNYLEIRPRETDTAAAVPTGFKTSNVFVFHTLDLRPSLDEIYRSFHKDCIQRKIQRGAREQLTYREGTSDELLRIFYRLLLITRRRHGVPTQPFAWFRNLVACLGDMVKIRVVSKDEFPVASIFTISDNRALVYKYGCSDGRFNNLGGTQLLFWNAIQEAKQAGLSEFDMGRSDCDERGLIAFKDRWGARRSALTYHRFPANDSIKKSEKSQAFISKYVWSHAPTGILAAAGRVLYRHMG